MNLIPQINLLLKLPFILVVLFHFLTFSDRDWCSQTGLELTMELIPELPASIFSILRLQIFIRHSVSGGARNQTQGFQCVTMLDES